MTDILDLIGGKLTDEQVNSLLNILNSEGKNVEINSDGTFETKIGHTYVVASSTDTILITNENEEPLCELTPAGQVGFVANTTISKTSSLNCTITEVFKYASLIQMSGGGISIDGMPAGYLQAEFLESTGTQWLSLPEVEINNTDTVKCTLAILDYIDASANGYFAIRGYDTGNKLRMYSVRTISDGKRSIGVQFGDFGVSKGVLKDKEIGEMSISERGWEVNGELYAYTVGASSEFSYKNLLLFNQYVLSQYWPSKMRLYKFEVSEKNKLKPALSASGTPCMFDAVSGMPFYNKGDGEFIVGFTLKQARKLSKLPKARGKLTISLPSSIVSGSTVTDSEVSAALTMAGAKGWSITVQTYEEESTAVASTFGMQRIWVRKTQHEYGNYTDENNNRWQVEWCVTMYTPDNSTPDQHGYEQFRSVEAACEYWGLTPYINPTLEEEINNSQT